MSRAPGSPSFTPPASRLRGLPRIDRLTLSPPLITPDPPPQTSEHPVIPIIIEPESTPEKRTTPVDDDVNTFDDEAWSRVANAGGIEEMLKLGEGISGSVSKCRLRKSGQVFAIKVVPLATPTNIRQLPPNHRPMNIYAGNSNLTNRVSHRLL